MNSMDKKIIAVLIIAILTIAGISVYLLFQPKDKPTVEDKQKNMNNGVKSAPELIAEQKFALVELTDEGFSENKFEVPLGGILEIRNSTDREVTLDIRSENFVGGLIIKAGEISYSPVFTQAGEYTLAEFTDGEINEAISAKVSVVK